jgi:subtilisin family serine protease
MCPVLRKKHCGGADRAFLALIALALSTAPGLSAPDPRAVARQAVLDLNSNRIADRLEQKLASLPPSSTEPLDLLVCFSRPPGLLHMNCVAAAGGSVASVHSSLVYAARVVIPPGREPGSAVRALLSTPDVLLIEENAVCRASLYRSTRQARIRPLWSPPYSLEGSASGGRSIAVLDTGLDDSHPDLGWTGTTNTKIAAWVDLVGNTIENPQPGHYTSPVDYAEHGSLVASIAAGMGAVGDATEGIGAIPVTKGSHFASPPSELTFSVDTSGAASACAVTSLMRWVYTSAPSETVTLAMLNPLGQIVAQATQGLAGPQPLQVSYDGVPPGTASNGWASSGSISISGNTTPYWIQTLAPLAAAGDGHPLMCGCAPGASLVGVKVLDDSQLGTAETLISGLEWVAANKTLYGIVAANLSLSFSQVVQSVDTAVNNLVSQGVVCVAAAGNGRQTAMPGIASPASASKCIAVVAISDDERITNYSSIGPVSGAKPDVAAPGGSFVTGRQIVAADSNDIELTYNPNTDELVAYPDFFPDDYDSSVGTSMAAAHVAGLAALLAQGMGSWDYTEAQALTVKMLVCMAATETAQQAEFIPFPTLDRGGRDRVEGFGRINGDASAQALLMSYELGSTATGSLGGDFSSPRAWAGKVRLGKGIPYSFSLTVPQGADFDLYIYDPSYTQDDAVSYGSSGYPRLDAAAATAQLGGVENLNFVPPSTGVYYLVVKRIGGAGNFQLTSSEVLANDAVLISSDIPAQMYWGQTLRINLTFMNSGLNDWTAAAGYRLTSVNPEGNTTWGLSQVALGASDIIRLGELKTFSFEIMAPSSSAMTPCDWRMMQSGAGQFGQAAQKTVGVSRFLDVPNGFWSRTHVEALAKAGVTAGCSANPPHYCPSRSVTRREMAVFIPRAVGKAPLDATVPTFQDVPVTDWAYNWIERLADPASWCIAPTLGCFWNPRLFCPYSNVTRREMAAFLCRAACLQPLNRPIPTFADVGKNDWAYGWIERLADTPSWRCEAPTTGCSSQPRLYCPNSYVTRAQMAVFLVKAFCIPP